VISFGLFSKAFFMIMPIAEIIGAASFAIVSMSMFIFMMPGLIVIKGFCPLLFLSFGDAKGSECSHSA